jgi:hypothetical protein
MLNILDLMLQTAIVVVDVFDAVDQHCQHVLDLLVGDVPLLLACLQCEVQLDPFLGITRCALHLLIIIVMNLHGAP